jgi:TonB family protein
MILARLNGFSGRNLLAGALYCVLLSPVGAGQTPDEPPPAVASKEGVSVETFRDPLLKNAPEPAYPLRELYRGGEGWVILSMMVDPQGKPFEVGVERSSGNRLFEKLAVKSMERATFEPGSFDGKPVESVYEMRYKFVNAVFTPGAYPEFISAYKSLQRAFDANDRAAADAEMQKLKVTTLYEDAHYGLAQYVYATRWGNAQQQESALWRALALDGYLSPPERRFALLANFQFQLKRKDFFQALRMWDLLKKAGVDKDTAAKIEPTIEQVERIRNGPAPYGMSGTIGENGSWSVHLFKSIFRAEVASGVISQVKLKCNRAFVSFSFDPQLQYEVQSKYGACELVLEGTPGTQFQLTQS